MELRQKVGDLESKVASTKQALDQLIQKRNAVDPSTSLTELERLTEEIRSHEKRLENFELLRLALAKKLRQYDANKGEGVKLRQETTSLYDEARTLIEKTIIPAQRTVGPSLLKIETINTEIRVKAKKHLELVGVEMNPPPPIKLGPALQFAGPGAAGVQSAVELVKVPEPWTYVSDEELKTEHQRMEADRFKQYQDHLVIANKQAPDCTRCGEKTAVDLHAGNKERPGTGIYDGHWSFYCKACGNGQDGVVPETKTK